MEEQLRLAQELATKLKSDLDAKDTELAEALKVIAELKAKLAAPTTNSTDLVVSVGKDKYKVVFPRVTVAGIEYTAQELVKNSEVSASLVKNGSGALLKIEK